MVYFRSCPPGRRRAEAMDIEVGAVNCTGQGQWRVRRPPSRLSAGLGIFHAVLNSGKYMTQLQTI